MSLSVPDGTLSKTSAAVGATFGVGGGRNHTESWESWLRLLLSAFEAMKVIISFWGAAQYRESPSDGSPQTRSFSTLRGGRKIQRQV
jgi:hypothetical protein